MDLQKELVSCDKHKSAFKFISWVLKYDFCDVLLLNFFQYETDGTVTANFKIIAS